MLNIDLVNTDVIENVFNVMVEDINELKSLGR